MFVLIKRSLEIQNYTSNIAVLMNKGFILSEYTCLNSQPLDPKDICLYLFHTNIAGVGESGEMKSLRILSSEYGSFRREIQEFFMRRLDEEPSVIFDPMAGTAPLIPFFEKNGHTAYLNDILPFHSFINKAKTYQAFQRYQRRGYDWFFQQLLDCMSPLAGKELCISDKWIDDVVLHGLIQAWRSAERYDESAATILKATILVCVRPLSSATKSKNPVWLKFGGISSGKTLQETVKEGLDKLDKYYAYHYGSCDIKKKGKCIITHQDASELRLPQKVDFILTSPSYCNRLDPIVQYGPENYFLSALGYTVPEEGLVSTTRVRGYSRLSEDFGHLTANSKYARRLLGKIKQSPVADDPAYYLKYYTRYFATLSRVIEKVLNNLSATGKMYMVTQDNTHRGELIEIDRVIRQLLGATGWQSKVIRRWPRHHLGLMNVSRKHAFVRPKQLEKLMVIWR
jgi:hypothetical protein